MITIVENSNICDVKEGLILQGVNCQGVMGSGVAKQLRDKYPEIFNSYKKNCNLFSTHPSKLLGYVDYYYPTENLKLTIGNCFLQENYGKDGKKYASYDALDTALTYIAAVNRIGKYPIHIPYLMGAGFGGLKEKIVLAMIEELLAEHTVYLHKFNK